MNPLRGTQGSHKITPGTTWRIKGIYVSLFISRLISLLFKCRCIITEELNSITMFNDKLTTLKAKVPLVICTNKEK